MVLVAFLAISFFEFSSLYNQRCKEILSSLEEISFIIETQNSRFSDLLKYGEVIFNQNSPNPFYEKLINEKLKLNSKEKVYELLNDKKNNLGNLTYQGDTLSKNKKNEMEKALSLTPLFIKAKEIFPNSPWIYYTSGDFIYIFPYVPSHEFKFSNDIINSEFYRLNLPNINKNRAVIWTNPYADLAGKGMMITASYPLYNKDLFYGTISIDVVLSEIEQHLLLDEYTTGNIFVANKEGNLIASRNHENSKARATVKIISNEEFNELEHSKSVVRNFSHIIIHKSIPALNFQIIYTITNFSFILLILSQMKFSYIVFISMIASFFLWRRFQSQRIKKATDDINRNKLISLAEMSGGIAHEINNPLTVILGRSSQLSKKIYSQSVTPDEIQKTLNLINSSANRISKIINALKSFSRNETLDEMTAVSLSLIINDALLLCENKINNIDFRLSIEEIPKVQLKCHAYQIVQILINLINNSVDAIEPLNEKWVKISFHLHGGFINIKVIDSGSGIPKNLQNKIFEPFFSTKVVGSGTGLGLSISKRLANYHDGDLTIDNNSSNTCFNLRVKIFVT